MVVHCILMWCENTAPTMRSVPAVGFLDTVAPPTRTFPQRIMSLPPLTVRRWCRRRRRRFCRRTNMCAPYVFIVGLTRFDHVVATRSIMSSPIRASARMLFPNCVQCTCELHSVRFNTRDKYNRHTQKTCRLDKSTC